MHSDTADLAGLVSARICHDLISPIGAAGNGLELLSLAGQTAAQNSPEMALITASLAQAQARLQFFRLAFGAADAGADFAHKELSTLLHALGRDSRVHYHCQPCAPVSRPMVQLICLSLLCLEGALPTGGTLSIASDGPNWHITAQGEKFSPCPNAGRSQPAQTRRSARAMCNSACCAALLKRAKSRLCLKTKRRQLACTCAPAFNALSGKARAFPFILLQILKIGRVQPFLFRCFCKAPAFFSRRPL